MVMAIATRIATYFMIHLIVTLTFRRQYVNAILVAHSTLIVNCTHCSVNSVCIYCSYTYIKILYIYTIQAASFSRGKIFIQSL